MVRISKQQLLDNISMLNALLERPVTMLDENNVARVGHLHLVSQDGGYQLSEIVTPAGASQHWAPRRMTAGEMYNFLSGVSSGLSLRNAQMNAVLNRGDGGPLYK